ncbi:MAG TPA: hypothetical protein VF316_18145 [Polyangiaceae bacterium]
MSPYRTPADRADATKKELDLGCPDADLVPFLLVFWLGSLARVVLGIVRHETFGGEATLATLAVLVVPFLLKDAGAWWLGRCKAVVARGWSLLFPYGRRGDR